MLSLTFTTESLARLAEALDEASDEERDEVIEKIIQLANIDRARFVAAVRALPITPLSPLFWFYEATAKDASNWEVFIVEEVNRLLNVLDETNFGSDLLTTLGAFGAIKDRSVRLAVTRTILAQSASPSARVRRAVAILLGDFSEPSNQEATEVLKAYASDSDWRVRVYALQTLNEDRGRPLNEGVRLSDRLRIRFLDLYKWR